MARLSSSLPWAWALETLADQKDVNMFLLKALVTRVPNISADCCKDARDRVSLRFMEECLDLSQEEMRNLPEIDMASTSGPKNETDLLNFLRKVATFGNLEKSEAEKMKHDLSQFILQKRVNLPKHALDELKDSILEGCQQSTSALWLKSRLNRENQMCYQNKNKITSCDNEHETTKRRKVNTDRYQIQSLKQNKAALAPEIGNYLLQKDPAERITSSGKGVSQRNTSVGIERVNCDVGDVHSLLQCSTPALPSNGTSNIMHQPLPENNCVAERIISSGKGVSQQNTSVGNERVNCDVGDVHSLLQGSTPALPSNGTTNIMDRPRPENNRVVEANNTGEHGDMPEVSSSGDLFHDTSPNFESEDEIVAAQKRMFINSQNQVKHNSPTKETEQRLCRKCDKGGQLLICHSCPAAIHESCLGSSASFEYKENFYCPVCWYEQAVDAYQRAKEKVALAKKDLYAYVGRRVRPPAKVSGEPIQASDCFEKASDHHVITAMEHQQQTEAATECHNDNLSCPETSLINEGCDGSLTKRGDHAEMVDNGKCTRMAEHQQQEEPPTACNDVHLPSREGEAYLVSDTHDDSLNKAEIENLCTRGVKHKEREEAVTDCATANSPCKEAEISLESERHAETRRQNAELQKNLDGDDPANLLKFTTKKPASKEKGVGVSSSKDRKRRKPAKRYSSIAFPYRRRKKLFWTAEEEDTLKEGVERFSKDGEESIPWTQIWEYGSNVFHDSRTPSDLKDKWRNIQRGLHKA